MSPVSEVDLLNCKYSVEQEMIRLEGKVLSEITGIKKDIETIKDDIEKLITRPEFEPVRMLAYGCAGGILIAALGAVMAKVLGW